MFARPTQSLFNTTTTNTNAFGTTSAFGTSTGTTGFNSLGQQQPQGSYFNNTSNNAFGSSSTSPNLFGQQQTTSLFGSAPTTQSQSSVFGSQPSTMSFGTNSLFSGASTMNSSQSLFGSKFNSTTAPFGASASSSLVSSLPVSGTTIKFNPFLSTDTMVKNGNNQNINTRHQCITCMKEYESKSLEELRYEDYQANRNRGTNAAPLFGVSNNQGLFNPSTSVLSFNTNNTTSSLFNNNKPSFGATTTTTTSIFNTTFNKPFGTNAFAPATTQTQQAQPTQSTNLFNAPISTPSTFGTQSNIFMSNQNSTANTTKNFFTATNTQPISLFSNPATTNNALGNKNFFGSSSLVYGAPASSSSFSFNPTSQPTSTTGTNLFSNQNLFNTGATANTQPKPFFSFSNQPSGLSQTNTLNTSGTTGSSLFNTSCLGTNLFNNMNTAGGNSLFNNNVNTTNTLTNSSATNQGTILSLQQLNNTSSSNINDLLMNRLQSLPYGSSHLFQNKIGSSSQSNLKFTTDPKTLNQYKVTFSNSANNSQVQRIPNNLNNKNTSLLFDGLDDENPEDKKTGLNIFVPRKNFKKLIIKPKENVTPNLSVDNSTQASSNLQQNSQLQTSSIQQLKLNLTNKNKTDTSLTGENTIIEYFRPTKLASTPANLPFVNSGQENSISSNISVSEKSVSPTNKPNHININSPDTSVNFTLNDSQNYSLIEQQKNGSNVNNTYIIPKCKVILTRTEYYTIPPLDKLDSEERTCVVENFTIGRHGYGSIYWEGPLDIYGLNLDEIVHIRRKEVIVYPDDDNKPEEGQALNRPAQITLHKVWPIDKTTHEVIKNPERLVKMNYSDKIENATVKFGGIFKEYRPDTGSWVFKVKHFSKYGLLDDEEETDNDQNNKPLEVLRTKFSNEKSLFYQAGNQKIENSIHDFIEFNQNGKQIKEFDDEKSKNLFDKDSCQNSSGFIVKNNQIDYDEKNLFNNNNDDEIDEDDMEESVEFSEPIPTINSYNALLRNVLFDNDEKQVLHEEQKVAKKSKLLFKPEIAFADYDGKYDSSFCEQPKIQYIPKQLIILEPDPYPLKNKVLYDISSIKCSLVPKVRFNNGFNKLIIIEGNLVNICELKLIPDFQHGNLNERFHVQMIKNSEIFKSSVKAPFVQILPKIENKYNLDHLEKLVKALYGHLDIDNEYEYDQERNNRIIDWLTEQNRKIAKPTSLYDKIIYYLSSNNIKSAVEDLIEANHPKLAILLSSSNNLYYKNNIIQQLLDWKRVQADFFIDLDLLKIYVLLSGEIKYRLSSNEEIDVLEGLSWTQQLSLLLLFSSNNDLQSCIENITCKTNDVEYHLIANHYPLEAMSSADNDLEAWFLHQSLKSYGVIKQEINSDVIHGLLASQLVAFNIKWACFIACHITNDTLRNYTLHELLLCYAQKLTEEDESWLKIYLYIPEKYIASVKATYNKYIFNVANYGLELLNCEEWVEAHHILVDKIFPELVINEDLTKLRELIDIIKPHKDKIANWYSCGAHLFDIYSKCVKSDEINLDLLKISFNFHLLKCKNNRQRLCQSEMARKINLILFELNDSRFILETPVPSDYAIKELDQNCRSILKEICF